MKIESLRLLMVLVYRPPGGQRDPFIQQLLQEVEALPRNRYDRLIVLGDFNLDQKAEEHMFCFQEFCYHLNLNHRSAYSTHIYGGILDLVFDNDPTKQAVKWMPSPYSDHFVLLMDI